MGLAEQEYRRYVREAAEHLVDVEEEANRVRARLRLRRAVMRVLGAVLFVVVASLAYSLWIWSRH